jgi:enoyl-CoA hydratase/carnithine racemase
VSQIRIERRGAIALLTFDRPHRLNAFTDETRGELLALLDHTAVDASVGAVVLTGAGRGFCSGEDLKWRSETAQAARSSASAQVSLSDCQEVSRRMVGHPKPILAAVNGVAVGFGAELAIASDIRIAAAGASFALPECKRALFVTNGALYLLPRIVGYGRALEMVLTGRTISATEALAAGLVSRVVPDEQIVEATVETAHLISRNAPVSLRLLKSHIRRAAELDFEGSLRLEVDAALECERTEDLAEGMRAFAEHREPRYQGR